MTEIFFFYIVESHNAAGNSTTERVSTLPLSPPDRAPVSSTSERVGTPAAQNPNRASDKNGQSAPSTEKTESNGPHVVIADQEKSNTVDMSAKSINSILIGKSVWKNVWIENKSL